MHVFPPDTRPAALRDHHTDADAVETLSDRLSATTVFASPRGDAPQPLSGAMAPMAPDEATPGFTPPPSPDQQTRSPASGQEPLPWQDARPPSTVPGERTSWLYVPLLHAAAGNLTARARQAWLSCPRTGPRFDQLVSILRGASSKRTALPDAPLPLAAAVLLCMAPDGYLTAAVQSTLLESYAGAMAATAARSLADDVRHTQPHAATPRPRRRRRNRRRTTPREDSVPPLSDGVPTCPAAAEERSAAASATPTGIHVTAWASLDEVSLATELQHPVPTLQDVPPFMRAAVRGALRCALRRLHTDYANSTGDYAATSRGCCWPAPHKQGRKGEPSYWAGRPRLSEATGRGCCAMLAPTAAGPTPHAPLRKRRPSRWKGIAERA